MLKMRSVTIAFAALAAVAVSAQPAADGAALYARYIAAMNAHDVDRAMAFYADDAIVVQNGSPQAMDRAVERGYREFEAATDSRFTIRIVSAARDSVDAVERETGSFLRALGVDSVSSRWIYRFRGGRIVESAHFNTGDPVYLQRYRAFRDWIGSERPADAARLLANGNVVFNGSTGPRLLELALAWGSAHPDTGMAAPQQASGPDDLLLINGKVFTADPATPWAEAVAMRADRITAVGTTAAIKLRASANTRVVDVGGRVVIPGINDAHTHVGARPPGVSLTLKGDDPAFDDVIAAIRETAATAPADRWIYGIVGERWLSDPKATRFTLDEAAPGRLVKLSAWTGHGVTFSTPGLRAIGLGDRDPNPPFAKYRRTAGGVLDGRFDEYADLRVHRRLTALAGRDAAVASLRGLAEEAIGLGITTIQAMGNALTATDLSTLLPEAKTAIRWRIIRFPVAVAARDAPADLGALPRQPAPLVTVSGVKWILDGTPVERFAAMNAPYSDRAGWTGMLNLSQADLDGVLRRALDTLDQPMFHIVGDRGVDLLFSSMERLASAERWHTLRVRIEHGEFLTRDRLARAGRLGIVNVQNPAHFTIPDVMTARFGAARAATAEPVRSILDAGIPLALGGDGPLNPFLNMMFATTHPNNPAEALTREQVVTAYTTGSAFAEFAERDKGRLAAGMLADVAVLTQDIFTVDPNKLPETGAALTIVNGRIVRDTLSSR